MIDHRWKQSEEARKLEIVAMPYLLPKATPQIATIPNSPLEVPLELISHQFPLVPYNIFRALVTVTSTTVCYSGLRFLTLP